MVKLRMATPQDAGTLLDIYSPYVLTTAISFETEVPSLQEFRGRIQRNLEKFPWLVCEIQGETAGYVYASTHREREAYQWTCECSVYIQEQFQGKGFGVVLYHVLFSILKMQGLVNVYAGITLPNEASVLLHEKCGFKHFALYENIGYKLGRWHKVGWWKLQLNDHAATPSPPLQFSAMSPQLFASLFEEAAKNIGAKLTG